MFAGTGALPHNLQMRVGRREDKERLDRLVVEQAFKAVAERKIVARSKRLTAGWAGAEGSHDLNPVAQIDEGLRMGRHRHAEPNDSHAKLRHGRPLALMRHSRPSNHKDNERSGNAQFGALAMGSTSSKLPEEWEFMKDGPSREAENR